MLTHTPSRVNPNSFFFPHKPARVCLHSRELVRVYFNLKTGLTFITILSHRGSGTYLARFQLCHRTPLLFFPASLQLSIIWPADHKYPQGILDRILEPDGAEVRVLRHHFDGPLPVSGSFKQSQIQVIVSPTGSPPTHKGTFRNTMTFFLESKCEVLSLGTWPPGWEVMTSPRERSQTLHSFGSTLGVTCADGGLVPLQ